MTTATTEPWVPQDTLAARLLLVRHQLGLTQREAAEQAGVGFGAWQSWENGRSPRDAVAVLAQVADRLKVRRDWLLFGGPLGEPPTPGLPRLDSDQKPAGAWPRTAHGIGRLISLPSRPISPVLPAPVREKIPA